MRALIISTLSLVFLFAFWSMFYHYSEDTLEEMTMICQTEIMPAIEQGFWNSADQNLMSQYESWHAYYQKALYILETEPLNDIEESFAKTMMYVKAEDLSNSSGELLALIKQLSALQQKEAFTVSNIL